MIARYLASSTSLFLKHPVSVDGRRGLRRGAAVFFLLLFTPILISWSNESYELKRGETLYRVSKKVDIPVRVLQEYNGIENPQTLPEGTRIRIPAQYRVKKGDTLYSISRAYQVDLGALMRLNGITDSTSLSVGAVLYIPDQYEESLSSPPSASASDSTGISHGAAAAAVLWPLPGRREKLGGRISGTVIHGKSGETVVSVSSGRVIWAGPYRGFSRVILIEGENGYTYVYAGNEETLVAVGDTVRPGAEIGRLGVNVHQGIPQLYFLVYRNGQPVDPSLAPRS
jgi:lipoprotein NlpD